jgi:hypothetical protein
MSTKSLAIFVLGTLALSACSIVVPGEAPVPVIPTDAASISVEPVEETPNQPVPVLGHDQARDVIVKYLVDQYGLTPPAEWQTVDQTPTDLVGSSKTMFVGDGWTVTVSAPVVAPEYLVYQIEVSDLTSGLQWMGTVDAFGVITEESVTPPVSVASAEDARDIAVKLVAEEQNLEIPMAWAKQPNKLVDNSIVETYTGGPWVVQVSYVPSAPFVGEYQIVIDHMQAVLGWQGTVDAHGNLAGSFVTSS